MRSYLAIIFIAFSSFVLAGCSGLRIVDSDVTAFAAWTSTPPPPGTPYRFERLPSQLPANAQQDRIEAIASTSLAKVGMLMAPATAHFSVQIVLSTQVGERFPEEGFGLGGPGVFLAGGNRGQVVGMSFPIRFGEPYYKREVSVLMRELASQKVVFESRALHAGPWNDALSLLPAMLDSALLGFPQPPQGTRRVHVEIPR